MVFHWSLNDSKSHQVSRILLSILADLNNAVVWMVCIRPLISKTSSPCTNPLVTIPSTPVTISITVCFMFYSFFSSPARTRYLSLPAFFQFYPVISRNSKVHNSAISLSIWLSLDLVVWSRLDDLFLSQNPWEFYAPHFLGRILGCAYTYVCYCYILTFYSGKYAIPKWCTGRKGHIPMASNRKKSRRRNLADEMGKGEKKKSHGALIDWCTGREWPLNCMTVIFTWWRSNMPFQGLSGRLSGRWTII